jgi:hypothetical protein
MLKPIKIFIFLSYLINNSYGQDVSKINNWLVFENFKDTCLFLPENFKDINSCKNTMPGIEKMFSKSIRSKKKLSNIVETSLKGTETSYWKKEQKIKGSFLDFLCEQEVINYYNRLHNDMPEYFYDRAEVVNRVKDSHDFYYFGQIKIDTNFESHLIFACTNDTLSIFFFIDVYMLNIKNNQLISIVQVSQYGAGAFFYTKLNRNKRFHYRGIYYHYDIVFARWIDRVRYREREYLYNIYTFDEQGFVNILYNKKEDWKQ